MPKVPNLMQGYRSFMRKPLEYGPTREDAIRWNEFLRAERARRAFVPNAIRREYDASRHFPSQYNTAKFRYWHPEREDYVDFSGTEDEYWDSLRDYMPEGGEWFHHEAYGDEIPYTRRILPSEESMLPETYEDEMLRDIPMRFRRYYEENPLPKEIPIKGYNY